LRKGVKTVAQLIKARFSNGKLEPLERLDLEEGAEVVISVVPDDDSEVRLEELMAFGARKAKEVGITTEEQVVEIIRAKRNARG
jgi:predicted DNA-binding antitoxin AbrB/MazE fold protein